MTVSSEKISEVELFETIVIECPKCHKQKKLKIPTKIINQSKQLTTVSIPTGISCEHGFQAFIDKNFKIRGYQTVDFDFSRMEFYEGGGLDSDGDEFGSISKAEEELNNFTSLPLFQELINLLRASVDDKEVLGSAMFSFEGRVLYSSLPHGSLFDTIREFEVRSEKKLINIRRMFLELENSQKVCSEYMKIRDLKFILVLMFSAKIKLGMGNLLLRELVKKIKFLT